MMLFAPLALAQEPPPLPPLQSAAITPSAAEDVPDFLRPIPAWDKVLDGVEALLGEANAGDPALADARRDVIQVESDINGHLASLRPRLAAARAQAERLGPAPAPGHAPEPSTIAQQRSALAATATNLSAAINAGEAALLRAEHLATRIRNARRLAFQENVLQRGPSALAPELWTQVGADVSTGIGRLQGILSDWQGIPDHSRFLRLLIAAIVLGAGLSYAGHRAILRHRRWDEPQAPPEWQRVASAGWVIVLRAVPTLAAAAFLAFGITAWDPLPQHLAGVMKATLLAIVTVMMVRAVSKTVLALRRPHWRLLRLSDEAAAKLNNRVLLLAIIYGADGIASALNEAANVPFSLNIAQSFISSVLYASLIIAILLIRAPDPQGGRAHRIGPAYIRLPLWLVAIAIILAALAGYVALARFIAGQLIVISTILTIAYLFLVWASAFGRSLGDDRTRAGLWLRNRLGLGERRREQIALPLTLILQSAIIVGAIPFILLQWGSDWQDIGELFRRALFGFPVGETHISLIGIVAALLVFVVGYIAARIVQGWLDTEVLEPAGVETSVRQSIRLTVGYLGIAIAAAVALSYAGLDISNLAIVAGALTVGIGFGLQSVVNNFISGLILLAERPIKVGDWIIVGGDEGIVRRISVRSTEIETFERSSVIVPNAILIAEKVKNWTLHDATGRAGLKVGVHCDSDPEAVRDVLLRIARAHPEVLTTPEPSVFFEDFGSYTLNFTLYFFLANIAHSPAVQTDLRIAIVKAFRSAGIEMPYPQADIHLGDLQWVKQAIAERIARPKASEVSRPSHAAQGDVADDGRGNGNGE
jgi:small-conductance mechanosensitive channel